MKLPTLVIAAFNHSVRADVDDIKIFLKRYSPEPLVADTRQVERLERLWRTLWQQWCQMEMTWHNHNPSDGNLDSETLAGLGKIVEATRVAVDDVLQISGRALEMTRGVKHPLLTTSFSDESPTTQQQVSQGLGGGATPMAEVMKIAVVTEADEDRTFRM